MNFEKLPGCFWLFLILFILLGPKIFSTLLLGTLMFGALGIIIVFFLANFFLRQIFMNSYLRTQTDAHNQFGEFLIRFMVQIAKADGEISSQELELIRTFFRIHMRYGSSQMIWVESCIRSAAANEESIQVLCDEFSQYFSLSEERILLQLLYQVALADGKVQQAEQELIHTIVRLLQFPEYEHEIIRRMVFKNTGSQGEDPLATLGLTETSTPQEIKKRYRELSKENHPDRVSHLGDEFKEVASEKMVRINQAYEQLKKQGRV